MRGEWKLLENAGNNPSFLTAHASSRRRWVRGCAHSRPKGRAAFGQHQESLDSGNEIGWAEFGYFKA